MARTIPKSLVEDNRTVGINRSLPKFQYDAGNTAEGLAGLSRLAGKLQSVAYDEAKAEAVAQGNEDALAEEMVRGDDGQLRPITRPDGGGQHYNTAFDAVADKRYVRRFGEDFEEKARQLALDPKLASDPVAYNDELTKAAKLALGAADESFRGVLADGVASVVGKYTTDQQVKAFNREYRIGASETQADIDAHTSDLMGKAISGQPITPEDIQNGQEISAAAAAYGLSYDADRTAAIAQAVVAPTYAGLENMTPLEMAAAANDIEVGNWSGVPGIDPDAGNLVPAAQRKAMATNIRSRGRLKAAGTTNTFDISTGGALSSNPGVLARIKEKFKDDVLGGSVLAMKLGVLTTSTFNHIYDSALRGHEEYKALLSDAIGSYRAGGDHRADLLKNLTSDQQIALRTMSDLQYSGVTLDMMNKSEEYLRSNPEMGFTQWKDEKATKALLTVAFKGLSEEAKNRLARIAWRLDTARNLENTGAAIDTAKTGITKIGGYKGTNISEATAGLIDAAGGMDEIMPWLGANHLERGSDYAAMAKVGEFWVRVEPENNEAGASLTLMYRPDEGDGMGVGRSVSAAVEMKVVSEYFASPVETVRDDVRDAKDAVDASMELKGLLTSTASPADTGAAIIITFGRASEEHDAAAVGQSAKRFYDMDATQFEAALDGLSTDEDKLAYNAVATARGKDGYVYDNGELRMPKPKDFRTQRVTRGGNNTYSGFFPPGDTYVMSGGDKGEFENLTGEEARARLPAATAMMEASDYKVRAEGLRQVTQLQDILFHYDRGGDLLEKDKTLRQLVGHYLATGNRFAGEWQARLKEVVGLGRLRMERSSAQNSAPDMKTYLMMHLGNPAQSEAARSQWDERHGRDLTTPFVDAIPPTQIVEFVSRLKKLAETPFIEQSGGELDLGDDEPSSSNTLGNRNVPDRLPSINKPSNDSSSLSRLGTGFTPERLATADLDQLQTLAETDFGRESNARIIAELERKRAVQ